MEFSIYANFGRVYGQNRSRHTNNKELNNFRTFFYLRQFGFCCISFTGYAMPLVLYLAMGGARWLSGRVSDSGARGPGFETYRRRVVSLSKTLYSPKVLVKYPGSDGSVPI